MAVFGTVVQSFVRAVLRAGRQLPFGRAVGPKLIGDNPFRQTAAFDQFPQ